MPRLVHVSLFTLAIGAAMLAPTPRRLSSVAAQGLPPELTPLDESRETALVMPDVSRPRIRSGHLNPALVAGLSGASRPVATRITLNLFPASDFVPPLAGASAVQTIAVFWTPMAERQGGGPSGMATKVVTPMPPTDGVASSLP